MNREPNEIEQAVSRTLRDSLEKLQRNADLTQRATDIELALGQLRRERKELGAAPEITGSELERFPALLADFGLPKGLAKALSDHHPEIVATTQELIAWFGSPAAVGFVFWLFGLCVSTKTEARDHMLKHLEKMTEAEVKAALSDASPTPGEGSGKFARALGPDHSEESVLKIEGKELPEFAHAPETTAEHIAAGALKADPERSFERKARRLQPKSKDSVRLWIKEGTVPREGRFIWSDDATADYKRFCRERNLEPVAPQTFGKVMRKEIEHVTAERLESGRTKYHGIGLRNNFKVVAA